MFTPTPNTATGADHARANADIDWLNAVKRCDGCSLVRLNEEAINASKGYFLWCSDHGLTAINGPTADLIEAAKTAIAAAADYDADVAGIA